MNYNKHLNSIKNNPKIVILFIAIFYCVGIAGFIWPATNALFLQLIPLALLLSFVLLALFHENKVTKTSLFAYFIIFTTSFVIEAIGVNTGNIFGNYKYESGLGIQLFQTPLLIGVNWVFLVYTSATIIDKINTTHLIKIVLASGIMLGYDLVMEQMASKLNMWSWNNDVIPVQNYIAWFVLAVLFHSLLKILKIKTRNKFAAPLLISQFLFFAILLLVSKTIQ